MKKILCICSTIIFFVTCFIFSWIPRLNETRLSKTICCLFCKRLLQSLDIKTELIVLNNDLPKNKILISNHVSLLDCIILNCYFNDCNYVGDVEHSKIPMVGRVINLIGTKSLDRKCIISKIESLKNLLTHVEKGRNLLVFPQGETSPTISKLKSGSFYIAKKTLVPIVPIFIEFKSLDDFSYAPPWRILDTIKKIAAAKDKRVIIRIFPNVNPEHYATEKELCDYILNEYQQWYLAYQKPQGIL